VARPFTPPSEPPPLPDDLDPEAALRHLHEARLALREAWQHGEPLDRSAGNSYRRDKLDRERQILAWHEELCQKARQQHEPPQGATHDD
jgi:hypothetical protein